MLIRPCSLSKGPDTSPALVFQIQCILKYFVIHFMWVMKRNNDSFNKHVEWICGESAFHRYCGSLLVGLQASTPCSVMKDNTALSPPPPTVMQFHSASPASQWEQCNRWTEHETVDRNTKEKMTKGIFKVEWFFFYRLYLLYICFD